MRRSSLHRKAQKVRAVAAAGTGAMAVGDATMSSAAGVADGEPQA